MPSTGPLSMTAVVLALVATAVVAQGEAAPVEVLLPTVAQNRWVEATPDAPGSPARFLPVTDGTSSLSLPGPAPGTAVLCAGGDGGATACERFVFDSGNRPVTLSGPIPGVRVTGRILSGKTPLAGAWFGIIPDQLHLRRFFAMPLERKGDKLVRTVSCDAVGRFVVPLLAPGTYRLDIHSPGGRIDLGEPFVVPSPEKLRPKKEQAPTSPPVLDLGDLVLDDGVRVEVSVVDSAGQPVVKAGVGAGQLRTGESPTIFEAHTGADGTAFLSRVDPLRPLSVTCIAPGFVRLEQSFETVPGLVRCVLAKLAQIEGRVVDGDEEPLPGATVALAPDGGLAKPSAKGEFSFPGLAPGRYVLTAAAPGMRAVRRPVEVEAETTQTETLRLVAAEALEGEVLDGLTKKPVPGAVVRVVEPPGLPGGETDEEGRFTLAAASEGSLGLEVAAAGYPVTPVEVAPEQQTAGEPVRIEIAPGGRVHFEVWEEETGEPCAGCKVLLFSVGRTFPLTTGADGSVLSELLSAGHYSVTAERVRSLGSVVTVRGGDERRAVDVIPNQTVTVELGEPLQRVQVAFSPPPPAGWNLLAEAGDRLLSVERSADGTFLVRRPRDTQTTLFLSPVTLTPPGMRIRQTGLPADFSAPVLTLPLAGGEVHGTLRRGEETAPGEPLLLVSTGDGAMVAMAAADEQGSFSIPFVPPGTYSLIAGRRPVQVFAVGDGPVALGEVVLPAP